MKRVFSIVFALALVVSLGLVTASPALAAGTIHVPGDYPTIQQAIDAAGPGDTVMVAAGTYAAFQVIGKNNIHIIGAEGATVTTAKVFSVDVGPIGDGWVMAAVKDSENISIEGIDFDGAGFKGQEIFVGIAYVDSTGGIADLTVENIIGTELGAGVAILGHADTSTVDLSGITVGNSMGGVIVWDAEANLDGCTITEMNPDGGFGIMKMGVGIVIGIPGGYQGPSTLEMKGSTISNNNGIGIYVCDDSILEAHFNTIMANSAYGLSNDGGGTVDATYNWWGHISGPQHLTNHSGMGNAVIGDVDFKPWLGARVVTKTVTNGTVDAREEADTEVWVTGTATVTVSKPTSNPGGDPPAGISALGRYIDVYVPDTDDVTEIEIRHYYTATELAEAGVDEKYETYLRLRWWDGTEWRSYSDGGVNTASDYMWARIRANTEPRLTDLTGIFNGDFIEGPKIPPCFSRTAVSGTNGAQKLNILREFRDKAMLPNALGAELVSFYYETSPPIAVLISRHEVLRTAVRVGFVDLVVKILKWSHDLWSARGS